MADRDKVLIEFEKHVALKAVQPCFVSFVRSENGFHLVPRWQNNHTGDMPANMGVPAI